jgi:O-antigen/teichoic acid export membrane protein
LTKSLLGNRLITDNLIMIIAVGLVNIFTYGYQLAMGALLSAEDYGTLLSMISLFVIISVLTQTITNTIAKKTASLKACNASDLIGNYYKAALQFNIILGLIVFIVLAVASPVIAEYLHLGNVNYLLILLGSLVLSFPLASNWGMLQGLERFTALGSNQALYAFLRTIIAVLLVLMGFGLGGAVAATSIALVLPLAISLFWLKGLKPAPGKIVDLGEMRSYASFTLIAVAAITVLTNIDVVIAKHFLSSVDAGEYAAIAVLGRVAFYAPAGIGIVLFPKTAKIVETKEHDNKPYLLAISLTLTIVLVICLVYRIFPHFVVHLLFSDKYPGVENYLFKYGMAMSLFAMSYLGITYALSGGKTKIALSALFVMLLQLALLILFHNEIDDFVNVMLFSGIFSVIVTFVSIPLLGKETIKEPEAL